MDSTPSAAWIAPIWVLLGSLFTSVATSCAAPSPAVPPRGPAHPTPNAATSDLPDAASAPSPSGMSPPPTPPDAAAPPAPGPEKAPAGFLPIPPRRKGGFPGVAFAEVRAYAFDLEVNGRPVCNDPLEDDGRLCSTVVQPGVILSPEQVGRLTKVLASPKSFGGGSSCFLPHHGFVYFDETGVPVATISVCFLCDMIEPQPAVPAARSSEGARVGISEHGREELQRLCRELGLPKCDARSPDDFRP